jgi:hypothetical protein
MRTYYYGGFDESKNDNGSTTFNDLKNKYFGKNDIQDTLMKLAIGGVTIYCIFNLGRAGIHSFAPNPSMMTPACTEEMKKYSEHNMWWSEVIPYIAILLVMWGTFKYNPSLAAGLGVIGICIIPAIFNMFFPPLPISQICQLEAQKMSEST